MQVVLNPARRVRFVKAVSSCLLIDPSRKEPQINPMVAGPLDVFALEGICILFVIMRESRHGHHMCSIALHTRLQTFWSKGIPMLDKKTEIVTM